MKLWALLSSLLLTYFLYGFYLSQKEVSVSPLRLAKYEGNDYYDYKGVINTHTNLSIGSSPPQVVIAAAKATGLDFLMITDLNQFERPKYLEGYHGRTLVMIGEKISYLDSRIIHYSLSGESLGANLGAAQVRLADMLSQSKPTSNEDLLILAHPYKSGFNWSGELPGGLDGFELLNAKSLSNRTWENSKFLTLWSLITYPFNPNFSFIRLFSEPRDEIKLYNELSQKRKTLIYAGAEASARAIPLTDYLIKFPSYQRSFEFLTNHVLLKSELTGQPENDRAKIFSALKSGSFYLCTELLGDPRGFMAWMETPNKFYIIGSEVPWAKNLTFNYRLPFRPKSSFEVNLIKNGEIILSTNQTEGAIEVTEAGIYRIEVRIRPELPFPDRSKWVTWIYTNHFTVFK